MRTAVSRKRLLDPETADHVRHLHTNGEVLHRPLYGPKRVHHTYVTLARMFGVTEQTIFNVVNYKGAYARDKQTQESEREYTTD
jgi:plasmid maintenance system antidote protein VapI